MTLEEALPLLKSGSKISRKPWLSDAPIFFIERKGLENPVIINDAGYHYSFTNFDIFADDWVELSDEKLH